MRRLGEADRAAAEAVLGGRVETSMFPLSNLAQHGMGVGRAILFSASEHARCAYRALGFREVGRFALLIFEGPQEVRRAAAAGGGRP